MFLINYSGSERTTVQQERLNSYFNLIVLESCVGVSGNLSTQFPKPPELQPLSSVQAKIRQIISMVLIVGGLGLLGTGAWMFYQYQVEASKPPPARILEVSLADLTETPTLPASPTQLRPTTLPQRIGDTLPVTPAQPPTLTLTPTSAFSPTSTLTPEPALIPTSRISGVVTAQAVIPTQAPTPTPPPTAEAALSLADNPLLVEEEETLTTAETVPTSPETSMPASSPPTRIVAESIGLDAEVVEIGWEQIMRAGVPTNVWLVADYAAGWHKNSALPGQGGNVVLSGHHNINGEVFRHTIDLEPGAMVTLYVGDQLYYYRVVDKFIVKDKDEPEAIRRENAKWIGPFNEERLTLVTCWPYTNNTHRAIVIAKPVSTAPASAESSGNP